MQLTHLKPLCPYYGRLLVSVATTGLMQSFRYEYLVSPPGGPWYGS